MRKVVNEVAELIRDLETLKQLTSADVVSTLAIKDGRQIFEVKLTVQEVAAEACVEMLKEVKQQNDISGRISVAEQGVYRMKITATFVK